MGGLAGLRVQQWMLNYGIVQEGKHEVQRVLNSAVTLSYCCYFALRSLRSNDTITRMPRCPKKTQHADIRFCATRNLESRSGTCTDGVSYPWNAQFNVQGVNVHFIGRGR